MANNFSEIIFNNANCFSNQLVNKLVKEVFIYQKKQIVLEIK